MQYCKVKLKIIKEITTPIKIALLLLIVAVCTVNFANAQAEQNQQKIVLISSTGDAIKGDNINIQRDEPDFSLPKWLRRRRCQWGLREPQPGETFPSFVCDVPFARKCHCESASVIIPEDILKSIFPGMTPEEIKKSNFNENPAFMQFMEENGFND